jgi:hypothetical protein
VRRRQRRLRKQAQRGRALGGDFELPDFRVPCGRNRQTYHSALADGKEGRHALPLTPQSPSHHRRPASHCGRIAAAMVSQSSSFSPAPVERHKRRSSRVWLVVMKDPSRTRDRLVWGSGLLSYSNQAWRRRVPRRRRGGDGPFSHRIEGPCSREGHVHSASIYPGGSYHQRHQEAWMSKQSSNGQAHINRPCAC